MTEPQTGSDAAAITTTAIRDGDHYVIERKSFTSNQEAAHLYFVAAKTVQPGHRGVSVFIVEKGTPGFTFGAKDRKMGIAACPTGELFFQDCRVPAANLWAPKARASRP